MIRLIIKRLIIAIPTLIIIIAFVFGLMRVAPGGPFTNERALPPEIEQKINEAYDLDKPLIQQFGIYLSKIAKGDLGPSYKYKDFTVNELILSGFPISLTLGVSAIVISLFLGSLLGIIAAVKRNTIIDYAVIIECLNINKVKKFLLNNFKIKSDKKIKINYYQLQHIIELG